MRRSASRSAVVSCLAFGIATLLVAQGSVEPVLTPEDLPHEGQNRELNRLAQALDQGDVRQRQEAWDTLDLWRRERVRRMVASGPPWFPSDARRVLALMVVDPGRFHAQASFRRKVLDRLPKLLPDGTPGALRDLILQELYVDLGGIDFSASEEIEVAWGAAPRTSESRRVSPVPRGLEFADDFDPIKATVFSFPSRTIDARAAQLLLEEVTRLAPQRSLLVLADVPMVQSLRRVVATTGAALLPTYGRPYSPWPRDPFSVATTTGGGRVLIQRSGTQAGREGDRAMGREIVQNLPSAIDAAWGEVRWADSDLFFHNGHILRAGGRLWVSLHALEREILKAMRLERVPVKSFAKVEAVRSYVAAARRSASALEELFGAPVSFVHPLPQKETADRQRQLMQLIGGGAGFDLDSLVTFLPSDDGGLTALVGDLETGASLLRDLADEEVEVLRARYGLQVPTDSVQGSLVRYQQGQRGRRLQAYLDLVARHLSSTGVKSRRLPLMLIPVDLLPARERFSQVDFVLGWHNVVLDRRQGRIRAEGFASLIETGDRHAQEVYRQASVSLDLLPPLVGSVIFNGGYRCASNQIRGGYRPRP